MQDICCMQISTPPLFYERNLQLKIDNTIEIEDSKLDTKLEILIIY
jgi:hypothetical protein